LPIRGKFGEGSCNPASQGAPAAAPAALTTEGQLFASWSDLLKEKRKGRGRGGKGDAMRSARNEAFIVGGQNCARFSCHRPPPPSSQALEIDPHLEKKITTVIVNQRGQILALQYAMHEID